MGAVQGRTLCARWGGISLGAGTLAYALFSPASMGCSTNLVVLTRGTVTARGCAAYSVLSHVGVGLMVLGAVLLVGSFALVLKTRRLGSADATTPLTQTAPPPGSGQPQPPATSPAPAETAPEPTAGFPQPATVPSLGGSPAAHGPGPAPVPSFAAAPEASPVPSFAAAPEASPVAFFAAAPGTSPATAPAPEPSSATPPAPDVVRQAPEPRAVTEPVPTYAAAPTAPRDAPAPAPGGRRQREPMRTRPIAPGEDVAHDRAVCSNEGGALLRSGACLPPGWYGDPSAQGGPVRWWDGSRLTDRPG